MCDSNTVVVTNISVRRPQRGSLFIVRCGYCRHMFLKGLCYIEIDSEVVSEDGFVNCKNCGAGNITPPKLFPLTEAGDRFIAGRKVTEFPTIPKTRFSIEEMTFRECYQEIRT